ncbi:MAG: hypothetical protein EP343_20775 [Deltaproteobacteria bacterium]|nr:MAG: hypothetical protein EP343_20775 [Deltaproteobacteria bacterium]
MGRDKETTAATIVMQESNPSFHLFRSRSFSVGDMSLVCTAGPHKGLEVSLDQEIMVVGRADWCEVSFLGWKLTYQGKVESNISDLLDAPDLRSERAKRVLGFLRGNPRRLQEARSRFATLLSQSKSKSSCRLLSILYRLAPLSPSRLGTAFSPALQMRHVYKVLEPLLVQYDWGPIVCHKVKLPAMMLTPLPNVGLQKNRILFHAVESDLQRMVSNNIGEEAKGMTCSCFFLLTGFSVDRNRFLGKVVLR